MSVDATHVRSCSDLCIDFLRTHIDRDWHVPIPGLEMTVARAVAHVAEAGLFYSIDLTAGGLDLECVTLGVKAESESPLLIETLRTCMAMLATAIDSAAPDAQGFHPWGTADRSGFAAMACDEMLVHTDDAARGLGVEFTPPPELAELTLRRLFPWVSEVKDPWAQLRWANGRCNLDDQPQLTEWKWHCAPLAQWQPEA